MINKTNPWQAFENATTPYKRELILAARTGNAKSMYFTIPAMWGSLESELHLLEELLQYLHKRHVTAHIVMPVIKWGQGSDAVVRFSGLVMWIEIWDMKPRSLVFVRRECRKILRQVSQNKVRHGNRESGEWMLDNTSGHIGRGSVASQVQAFVKDVREDVLANKFVATGVIRYRVNKRGVLESAEVDFREEATRLKFSEVSIPEPETRQPECGKAGRRRSPGGSSGRSRRGKPRRWSDLIKMCR